MAQFILFAILTFMVGTYTHEHGTFEQTLTLHAGETIRGREITIPAGVDNNGTQYEMVTTVYYVDKMTDEEKNREARWDLKIE
jgi:hypothetical protein